jgi:acetolactate synthase I/III small subunit
VPMTQRIVKNSHTISMIVANKPGVLVRIALTFARRGFNIDSLVVSPAYNPRFSRMTITAQGDPRTLDPIIQHLNKLIDVIHAAEHTEADAIYTELGLFKVGYSATSKIIILKLMKKYHTRLLDDADNILVIEQTGTTEQLDDFEALLKKYNLLEMVRTGKVVMVKGHTST